MKYVLIPILLVAAAALITYLIGRSVKKNHGKNEAAQILWYGNDREYYIYEMLASAFPRKNVFRNLYCPVKLPDRVLYTEVDIVTVTHGGVVVIEVKGSKGNIDNPPEGDWCQRYKDKVMTFKSPYKQNEVHVRAIEALLKRAGILNVPVYNVVVFADKNVRFTNNYKWLFKPEGIVDHISGLDDRFTLSGKDIKNVVGVLSKYTKKRTDTLYAERQKQNASRRPQTANNAARGQRR